MKHLVKILCILLTSLPSCLLLDFWGSASQGLGFLKDSSYCKMTECCNDDSIPKNVHQLENILHSQLFGQHIVYEQLIPALRAHLGANSKARKPLVISFHGTPGTGKTFVVDKIVTSLYAAGWKSKFVHHYMGRSHFQTQDKVPEYRAALHTEIKASISNCPYSLFIFDEVDKMPERIFESIASILDYSQPVDGLDTTKAIFIFVSNTASVHISDQLGALIKSGMLREETKLSHFERTLEKAAYNIEGGMRRSSLIVAHVIDHYIPFLPMEKKHVYKCVEAEFQRWNVILTKEIIESIIESTVTYDQKTGLFTTSGCKKIDAKVAVEVNKATQKNSFGKYNNEL